MVKPLLNLVLGISSSSSPPVASRSLVELFSSCTALMLMFLLSDCVNIFWLSSAASRRRFNLKVLVTGGFSISTGASLEVSDSKNSSNSSCIASMSSFEKLSRGFIVSMNFGCCSG